MSDDVLNSPEMLDWIRCQEKAVQVGTEFFQEIGLVSSDDGEKATRALLARLATAGITVEWNRE